MKKPSGRTAAGAAARLTNIVMNTENDKMIDGSELEQPAPKKQNKVGKVFNKFFHFYERGSTMKTEILAGLSVFLISICALFMNISILTSVFADDIPYLGMYLAATIISFIGTLLIGLLANRPLVQCASLSMSSVFVSMIGANTGLTYTNLLAVTFIGAIIYVVLMAIPAVRKFLYKAVPAGVRKALPIAIGLYIAYYALKDMGLTDLVADASAITSRPEYTIFCIAFAVIAILMCAMLKYRKSKHPYLYTLVATLILFYLCGSLTGTSGSIFSQIFSLNRVYVGINPDPNGEMYLITDAWSQMQLGTVFTTGFDFSAFTEAGGNVFFLFVECILVFVFMGMYETEGAVDAAIGDDLKSDKKSYGMIMISNSVTNVIAPIFGVAPLSVGKQSSIATGDGAKTGLSSVVCAIGYLIAMFTWVFFLLLATNTPVVPEYGHAGYVFPTVINCVFGVTDGVMLVMGVAMLSKMKAVNWSDIREVIVFGVTVVVAVFTQNIVYGVAFGVLTYVISKLLSFKAKEIKSITIPTTVLAVLMLIVVIFMFAI